MPIHHFQIQMSVFIFSAQIVLEERKILNSTVDMISSWHLLSAHYLKNTANYPRFIKLLSDLFWPVLCHREPVQVSPSVQPRGSGGLQGQKAPGGSAAHLLYL